VTFDHDFEPSEEGNPVMERCPAENCVATEGLWLMECAPGRTWTFVNDCGHWGFIHAKPVEK
jgi:hypothetical protein